MTGRDTERAWVRQAQTGRNCDREGELGTAYERQLESASERESIERHKEPWRAEKR